MWDDQPVQRRAPPVDMPPSTRAFLSQFNRSFTPPALINDPYAVDKRLVITPLLFSPRSLHVSRNPSAVDPAVERLRHYMGCEDLKDPDLHPSPVLQPAQDDDWVSDEEENPNSAGNCCSIPVKFTTPTRADRLTEVMTIGDGVCAPSSRLGSIKGNDVGDLPFQNSNINIISSPEPTPTASQLSWCVQPVEPHLKAASEPIAKPYPVSTPPVTHVSVCIGSPAQSDVPTMTSWDEWDGPSDRVVGFDPTTASQDVPVVHYNPLL